MLKTVPQTPWLLPEDHAEVVRTLYEAGLLKTSDAFDLPLKSGGKTDVYINLREARGNPEAIEFISELFGMPLARLKPDRFVEIPDAVSCFAGPLSVMTGIPYLTIREQAKEGRVADAKTIGTYRKGDSVVLLDDVITDGESKIVPFAECQKLGLSISSLVVLVDRQQGWQKHLAERGVKLNVWPGMTLHDVRRSLVELGYIKRCSAKAEAGNPIIAALDGKEWDEILTLISQLRPTGTILKVNDLMFEKGFGPLVPNLSVYGRVMVDLKGHDIPNTIGNIMKRLAKYLPWAVTIHASGGKEMIETAVKMLANTPTKVLAVTVLTSINPATCEEIYLRQPWDEVLKLAEIAKKAGAHGLVCSPQETKELRRLFPDFIIVNPGVRSPGKDAGDQQRIDTPRNAMDNGANYLVMGRQLLGAPDPVAEETRVMTEELGITLN